MAPSRDTQGQQGRRGHQHHLRTEGVEQRHIGSGHPAVQDVPHDHHPAALDATEALTQGQRVQQGLGRMLMGAIARIDHRRSADDTLGVGLGRPFSQQLRSARGRVPDDEGVGASGPQGQRGVAQGLALCS